MKVEIFLGKNKSRMFWLWRFVMICSFLVASCVATYQSLNHLILKDLLAPTGPVPTRRLARTVYWFQNPNVLRLSYTQKMCIYNRCQKLPRRAISLLLLWAVSGTRKVRTCIIKSHSINPRISQHKSPRGYSTSYKSYLRKLHGRNHL